MSLFQARYFIIVFMTGLLLSPQLSAQSISIQDNNGDRKMVFEDGRKKLTIHYEGEFTLSEDDRSIASVSPGGYLEVEEKTPGTDQELRIEPDGDQLDYRYRKDGRTTEYNSEAKAWFADLLSELVRNTGLGAESRVARFYEQAGTQGVLKEISNLTSDHARTLYFKLLLDRSIPQQDITEVIEAVGNTINSDHYRTEIFKEHHQVLLADAGNVDSYLSAIKTVESDHYKTELINLVVDQLSSSPNQANLLTLIATLDSDHYKHEVISRVVRTTLAEENLAYLVRDLLPEIESDHYRSEVVNELLDHQKSWSGEALDYVIQAIGQMESDHYQAESFKRLLHTQPLGKQQYDVLHNALTTLESDHYKSEVMRAMLQQEGFVQSLDLFLEASRAMDSDHYRVELLRTLINETELNDEQLANVVSSANTIESDHYLSELLLEACQKSDSETVKDAIIKTAKSISSDNYYGRVMKCIH
uniref:Uncharacterized protein n=1 Tax=Roseihalotalea indica TaxID=2867963 RepID=A0AA49GSR3_9BACT|nr:hypothetical protein K4G66_09375 [Tunicatimonas sp. TK19036]